MPTIPLPSAHLLDDLEDSGRIGVHVRADGVEADEIARRGGRGAEGFDGVAGDPVRADDALLLSLGEHVHGTTIARGPVAFGDAVDEYDVDHLDAELAAVALESALETGGIANAPIPGRGPYA
jgi:hypothetical protein